MTDIDEKRRRELRRAITVGGDPGSPVNARHRVFVRLVQQLDEMHVQLLDFLAAPGMWFQSRGQRFPADVGSDSAAGDGRGSIRAQVKNAFPAYVSEDALLDMAVHELHGRGLISITTLDTICQPAPGYASSMGRDLLAFTRAADR